jgi:hypothetical protein
VIENMSDYKSKESGQMEETNENTQEHKPKIYLPAVLSPLIVIFGILAGTSLALSFEQTSPLFYFGLFVLIVSPLIGLVLGIIADREIYKSKGALKGRLFSISGTGLAIIGILWSLMPIPVTPARTAHRVICASNLGGLGKTIRSYSDQYDHKYPTSDRWCDLIAEYADVNEIWICRGALKHGDKGPCHYAINPNCSPNSPPDTVLLFETTGGWNQHGGPEILTTENHEGEGCNILFNNCKVEFIKPEQFNELKWGNEPKDEPRR